MTLLRRFAVRWLALAALGWAGVVAVGPVLGLPSPAPRAIGAPPGLVASLPQGVALDGVDVSARLTGAVRIEREEDTHLQRELAYRGWSETKKRWYDLRFRSFYPLGELYRVKGKGNEGRLVQIVDRTEKVDRDGNE